MSTAARAYYEGRTDLLSSRLLPGILDGNPASLLDTGESPVKELVAARFAAVTRDAESYVLDAVRFTFPRRLLDTSWEEIRNLPPYQPTVGRADKYAARRMTGHLLARAAGARVLLEALPDEGIPEAAYRTATANKPIIRTDTQEIARVALLARTVHEDGEVSAAYFTVLWGEYKVMPVNRGALGMVDTGFLTPRYYGAPVLRQELSGLPPLVT